MLRDLKEKDNMKEYRGNVSRAGNSKDQKEMLEINTVTDMKNASVGSLVDDIVEERITEVEDTRMSVETFQMKNKGKRGKPPRIPKNYGTTTKGVCMCNGNTRRRKAFF